MLEGNLGQKALFSSFFFGHTTQHMGSQFLTELVSPAEVQQPNHWTTWEAKDSH